MRTVFALALLVASVAAAADNLAPAPPKDPSQLGLGCQRTMKLLASSTPARRNKVRILFYGQSITEQDWWKIVAADLRKRFPNADLEIENRAIGGFASQLLIKPAEHDLYPFQPDLLIFHVYGGNNEYEQIIKNVRTRTSAEVIMQTDHLTQMPPDTIDMNKDKGAWWDNLMNTRLLPDIAKKYGCGICDNRSAWIDYCKANKLDPKALLKDGVHLNDHGNFLMAELVKRYLVPRPDLPADGSEKLSTDIVVAKDAWKGGKLTLEFEGHRIDAIAGAADGSASAAVTIDGKSPAEFEGAYRITRPQPGPWSPLTVTRVDHEKPLVIEDWTLKVTEVGPESKTWKFTVTGSKTGADGAGGNESVFTSASGRVKIDSAGWFRNGNVPNGWEIKWKVLPMFVEQYVPTKSADASREAVTTLIQGIPNGKHTLVLTASGAPPAIAKFRVYRPGR